MQYDDALEVMPDVAISNFAPLLQVNVKIYASKERKSHSDGYETWETSKNMKRKSSTPKRISADNDDNNRGEHWPSFLVVTKPAPKSGNKSKRKQKEVAPRASTRSSRTRRQEVGGTVVITEEYSLLLSLKKNVKTPSNVQIDRHGGMEGMAQGCHADDNGRADVRTIERWPLVRP